SSDLVVAVSKGSKLDSLAVDRRIGVLALHERTCSRRRFIEDPLAKFLVHMSDEEAVVLEQLLATSDRLERHVTVSRGEELGKKHVAAVGSIPMLVGEDISRYQLKQPSHFVEFLTKDLRTYIAPKIVVVKTGDGCIA